MTALRDAEDLAASRHGVITAAQCRKLGVAIGDVRGACRHGRWRRALHGVYLVERMVEDESVALAQAAVSSVPAGSVCVLQTAALLHRLAVPRSPGQLHVSVPPDQVRAQRRRDRTLRIHQLVHDRADRTAVAGVPCTTPVRTVADLILRMSRYDAVALLDSALQARLIDDVGQVEPLLRGRRGCIRARQWLGETAVAESPLETRVRLRCIDGGVPPSDLQYEVLDGDGVLLARADFAWRRQKLLVEADGEGPHGGPEALFHDRRRQNLLVAAGYRMLRFTWKDTLRPETIPAAVRAALARASYPADGRRRPAA
ncbi:type IV toxin-antitoxin system AbiEi family antitoxin domain-containing protein [Actinocatenispora sera]|uniref:DUF559 domain-containing protein n=1 Tax=Actinocatenispora sera TaxID=390989 RepID=A0A810L339_9ACTN|nr:type IV toxin-antitoxin system AbiEi family antitoxin domain-containing protein [Actinocatenispora sera]BCJ29874.1 hypothetical protein Asera_39820 [Actinocatenispora sera]